MKLIYVLVTCYLNLIQIIDSKKVKIIVDDEVLPYEFDKTVQHNTDLYFNFDNVVIEQIDDEVVNLSGYILTLKSLDPKSPIDGFLRTQYLDRSSWVEGPIRLVVPNVCPEFQNPLRFWYNISKLWTSCPPQAGDHWMIEPQTIDIKFDLPASIPITQWKFSVMYSQGLPGFEKMKVGLTFLLEFVLVQ